MTVEPTDAQVKMVTDLAGNMAGRLDLARLLAVQAQELALWRSVFGPESSEQLDHLAGCMYCVPVCGHEEERCSAYDALATSVAQRMGDDAARRALREDAG